MPKFSRVNTRIRQNALGNNTVRTKVIAGSLHHWTGTWVPSAAGVNTTTNSIVEPETVLTTDVEGLVALAGTFVGTSQSYNSESFDLEAVTVRAAGELYAVEGVTMEDGVTGKEYVTKVQTVNGYTVLVGFPRELDV